MANINETFTGTNGSTPSGWTSTGSGSATIQSNAYRIVSPATGTYVTHRASRTGLANGDGTVDITVSTLTEHYPEWLVRSSSATAYGNGYSVVLLPADNLLQILEWSGGSNSVLGTGASFTYTAGLTYRVRFQWNGSTLRAKIWEVGDSEPGSWMVDTTDASVTAAGTMHFTCTSGGAAGARTATFDNLTVTDLDAASPQTITATGIGSAEAFGTAVVNQNVVGSGIASAEAFGTASVKQSVSLTGISSAETFGSASVAFTRQYITPTGIATAEAFGSSSVKLSVAPSGIASAEGFGTATVSQFISATGIASAETFGSLAVSAGAIIPVGIASAEAFGSATVTPAPVTITATGIASAAAFGTATVKQSIVLSGIASSEAFGTAAVYAPQAITVGSIASEEAFGSPVVGIPGREIDLFDYGIPSGEAFGDTVVKWGRYRLINPSRVDKYRLGVPWNVQYVTNEVGFTVLGDDAGLEAVETPTNEAVESAQYVWQGGHDNITEDVAIYFLWKANGFDVEIL